MANEHAKSEHERANALQRQTNRTRSESPEACTQNAPSVRAVLVLWPQVLLVLNAAVDRLYAGDFRKGAQIVKRRLLGFCSGCLLQLEDNNVHQFGLGRRLNKSRTRTVQHKQKPDFQERYRVKRPVNARIKFTRASYPIQLCR